MMMDFNTAEWMLPNCPEACNDLGDMAGLPLDPNDDKYEKISNDTIADQGCKSSLMMLSRFVQLESSQGSF